MNTLDSDHEKTTGPTLDEYRIGKRDELHRFGFTREPAGGFHSTKGSASKRWTNIPARENVRMGYRLRIVKVKSGSVIRYPIALPRSAELSVPAPNPTGSSSSSASALGGPFDPVTRNRLREVIASFPFTKRVLGAKDCWECEAPGGGRVEVLFTLDGQVILNSQAGLELALAIFMRLQAFEEHLALADEQRGVLHDVFSFDAWLLAGRPVSSPLPETTALPHARL